MTDIIKYFIEEEDQWFEHGWKLENDVVYSYTIDRKEQNMQKGRKFTIEEFLTDDAIDINLKRWVKDALGDSCDIVIEEDIPYK